LHELPDRARDETTGQPSLSSFADDVGKLRGYGEGNKESLGQLLFHFFRLYGHEIDYEKEAISVRQGKRIPREEKGWHPGGGQKEGVNRLCVEEPFNTERNLGNSADDYAWRGIHLELRRAFDLLADGQQLDKACEQFEYPPEEKSSAIFKKPQSQKAIITSSVPNRNGRGAQNSRGRGGFSLKNQHGGSRRSSGSSSYAQGRPPFLHSPPIPASAGPEYFSFPRSVHDQLHDQLYQQYQMLEMQSNSLRAQLAAQQHAQQAHQVRAAQMHAHAVAQAQAQAQGRAQNSASGSPQKSTYPSGRQSPRLAERGIPPGALPQGFLYNYPGFFSTSQPDPNGSQDGSRTNPSSPSMSNSLPGVHHGVHHASNASETSSLRSHSQPPRSVGQPVIVGYPPMPQLVDPGTFAGYPIARSSQDAKPQAEAPKPNTSQPEPLPSSDTSTPKEYVGYYVAEQPVRSLQEYAVPAIPSFSELAQRRRRVSPEITQPLLNTALRRVTRSPSPLGGHMRSYSTGVTQPNDAVTEQRKSRIDSVRPPVENGPVIVNGSFPSQPRLRSETVDAVPPEVPTQAPLMYPTADQQALHQIQQVQAHKQMLLQEMQRQKMVEAMGPPIVNGSMNGVPSLEANGLTRVPSEGQSFPVLGDGWVNYDTVNGHQSDLSEDISPTRTVPHQWSAPTYTNGLPSLETSNAQRAHPQEIKSAAIPLLSPVMETRTPSPTVNRSSDLSKLVNGNNAHKTQAKPSTQRQRGASLTGGSNANGKENRGQQQKSAQSTEKTTKSNTGASPNSWQQQTTRKKGKNKKPRALDQKPMGEPMPVNAAERKGG